ncbi:MULTISPECIES: PRC-barrel domain-containing protein [Streptomyces]|uniref:PRC-barrel domain containing protein n=2 Tax=Streptomyces TaxID=1883 RepID=A0A420UZR7_9ACTN|nr:MULTISPECIES: PRC-barrel domain-containing protein [Streptomyces]MZE81716.1 PRC-barrel domain containing protein [Streptomyces sp. SID5475]KNE81105.1 photosystem reaction center subunit H [Streptomyces fradiae]OFA54922.1 photosystem reaction center subunit H [Streptomyces fradiae]PQM21275.1 PRC-barrel domain containing protein [Streptomyces xinghaiensis]RKM93642.1 PRC-barrel domain containing protein [Streptomyces xinghaiensis]
MFEAENIKDWRGHAVLDAEGRRIGELESVYVDTSSDEPAFSAVLVGLPTRRRLVFVPLDGATVGPGHLKVRVSRKQVKNAPSIDRDGELLAEEEAAVFAHYERPYRQGAGGRRLARR